MWRMRSSLLLRTEVLFEGAAIRRGWAGGRGGRLRVGCRMTVKRGGCVTYVILPSLLGGGSSLRWGLYKWKRFRGGWVGWLLVGCQWVNRRGEEVGDTHDRWAAGWSEAREADEYYRAVPLFSCAH